MTSGVPRGFAVNWPDTIDVTHSLLQRLDKLCLCMRGSDDGDLPASEVSFASSWGSGSDRSDADLEVRYVRNIRQRAKQRYRQNGYARGGGWRKQSTAERSNLGGIGRREGLVQSLAAGRERRAADRKQREMTESASDFMAESASGRGAANRRQRVMTESASDFMAESASGRGRRAANRRQRDMPASASDSMADSASSTGRAARRRPGGIEVEQSAVASDGGGSPQSDGATSPRSIDRGGASASPSLTFSPRSTGGDGSKSPRLERKQDRARRGATEEHLGVRYQGLPKRGFGLRQQKPRAASADARQPTAPTDSRRARTFNHGADSDADTVSASSMLPSPTLPAAAGASMFPSRTLPVRSPPATEMVGVRSLLYRPDLPVSLAATAGEATTTAARSRADRHRGAVDANASAAADEWWLQDWPDQSWPAPPDVLLPKPSVEVSEIWREAMRITRGIIVQ